MSQKIDINADMGESFGRWTLGQDSALMPFLTSANIACGFHGSDPLVMRTTVRLAKEHGVAIGAHVGLPDLLGFGRRRIEISPQELRDYVVYQAGALQAFAKAEGTRLDHVKPHGALYNICYQEDEYAAAVTEAVKELGEGVILLLSGARIKAETARQSVPFVAEGYVDLDYRPDGTIILERFKQTKEPASVARRAVSLAVDGKVPLQDGGWLPLSASSVCVHGDSDNAPAVAKAVRSALETAGVQLVPLRHLVAA